MFLRIAITVAFDFIDLTNVYVSVCRFAIMSAKSYKQILFYILALIFFLFSRTNEKVNKSYTIQINQLSFFFLFYQQHTYIKEVTQPLTYSHAKIK